MQRDIQIILERAVYAPSGDNSQPWRFIVKANVISIFNQPEKDNPIFNYRQRGSLLAHGSLIENIVLLAREFGYKSQIVYLPDNANSNHTADIILDKTTPVPQLLTKYIMLRATNRKRYDNQALSTHEINELLESNQEESVKVLLLNDTKSKQTIGKSVSVNEVVMLENKELHDLFFNDVRWTKAQEQKHKTGLYLKTMELDLPKLVAFWLLQFWPINRFLIRLGIAKFIAKENAKIYKTAGAMVTLAIADKDVDFIRAGRTLQRLWLTACKLGLSIHLLTGVAFLEQRVSIGKADALSVYHQELVDESYQQMKQCFVIPDERLMAVVFRIGRGGNPSGRSSKIPPLIEFI